MLQEEARAGAMEEQLARATLKAVTSYWGSWRAQAGEAACLSPEQEVQVGALWHGRGGHLCLHAADRASSLLGPS